jgi:uncharacterized protein (TIGR03437 family)
VEFQVDAVSAAENIEVSASLGSDTVKETIEVTPDRSVRIRVPGKQFVKYGTEVHFKVSPADPAAALSAGELPAGAYFDPANGEFRWTPDGTQLGSHDLNFNATESDGAKVSASVSVQVDSGLPIATGIVNAASRSRETACAPGAIASILGRWLTDGVTVSDPSGNSMELVGTKVWANGTMVPILSAAPDELNILCPDSVAGSELQFVVQTAHGVAEEIRTTARSAAPGIFSVDGSGTGQGSILLEGTDSLATVRNYRVSGQPAMHGERLVVYATGIDRLTNIVVRIGDVPVSPAAVKPVLNHPGLYQVVVSMPDQVLQAHEVPVLLSGDAPDYAQRSTNLVIIAVESQF